jgi:organic hydroperoxide reductase OsmC/OhrA
LRQALVQSLFEAAPEVLAADGSGVPGTAGLELDGLDGRIVVAVATGVALGFGKRAEAPHDPQRMGLSGRQNPAVAREFRYTVDLGETLRTEDGTPLGDSVSWTPEHLLLAALIRCTLKSLDFHARRAGNAVASERATGRALFTKRGSDGRYAAAEIDLELAVELRTQPGEDELRDLLAKAERDCFIGASLTVKPRYDWTVS